MHTDAQLRFQETMRKVDPNWTLPPVQQHPDLARLTDPATQGDATKRELARRAEAFAAGQSESIKAVR